MRSSSVVVTVALVACGAKPTERSGKSTAVLQSAGTVPSAALPPHSEYSDLGAALTAILPRDARVIGFGELHARTDRPVARTSLAAFTAALPAIADRISDLVVETWAVNPMCGTKAQTQATKLEQEVRRPVATKNEVQLLAETARAAQIQPHAMTLQCADYAKMGDLVEMLGLTTKELTRIATSAVRYRDHRNDTRPWIAVYGGAVHNNRFPDASIAEWSYARDLDAATRDHFVEVDIFVPELAEADDASRREPWFAFAQRGSKRVVVWQRGERSFVVVLPRM